MQESEQKCSIGRRIRYLLINFIYLLPVLSIAVFTIIFHDRLRHVINPLVISVLMFFVLETAVETLERRCRVKRNIAILVVYFISITVLVGIAVFIIPLLKNNVADITESLPELKENVVSLENKIYSTTGISENNYLVKFFRSMLKSNVYGENGGFTAVLENKLEKTVAGWVKPKNIINIAGGIIDLITSAVITFYLLRDKEKAGNTVLAIFPYGWRGFLTEIYFEIEKIFKSFVSGQLLIALIIGAAETVGLWLIGTPYPLLFGIIGGLSNLIPYFGPFIGAVPAVLATVAVAPFKALLVLVLFVAVQQIDNNFISPKVLEGKLGVHPVASILAVFIGGEFFGLKGMLLAVPVYAIFCCIFVKFVELSHADVERKQKI